MISSLHTNFKLDGQIISTGQFSLYNNATPMAWIDLPTPISSANKNLPFLCIPKFIPSFWNWYKNDKNFSGKESIDFCLSLVKSIVICIVDFLLFSLFIVILNLIFDISLAFDETSKGNKGIGSKHMPLNSIIFLHSSLWINLSMSLYALE